MTVIDRSTPTWWSPRTRAAIFFVLLGLGLVITMAKLLRHVLPANLAAELGNYGESFLYVAIVVATIHLVRRHRPPTAVSWALAAAFALTCVGLTVALRLSDLPPGVRTLTEPLFAAGISALYLNLPRPVRYPVLYTVLVLVLAGLLYDNIYVREQLETVGFLALLPIAVDVVDRSILEPDQPNRPVRRIVWCVFLALLAVVAIELAHQARPELNGFYEHVIDSVHRAAEAYWAWILIHVYFGFWLPWRGLGRAPL